MVSSVSLSEECARPGEREGRELFGHQLGFARMQDLTPHLVVRGRALMHYALPAVGWGINSNNNNGDASMNKIASLLLLTLTATITSGCVVGRRSIALDIPAAATAAPASKGAVAIASVSDQRAFENKPDDPSTPSIDGDVAKASRDSLKAMIGRQRNGWGKAMGDIELASGDTVESRARALITVSPLSTS